MGKEEEKEKPKNQHSLGGSLPTLRGPALAHLHSLLPAAESLAGLVIGDAGLEDGLALGVDVLEVVKVVPDADGETGSDGGAEGRRLAHRGAVDGDANEVTLGLKGKLVSNCVTG